METRYNNSIDLQPLYDYCEQHGEVAFYDKGERLTCEGEPAQWWALVKQGGFKYMTHGISDGSEHIVWFSFAGEFAGDYPNVLYGGLSRMTLEAMVPSQVLRISGERLREFFNQNIETKELQSLCTERLLTQFQAHYIDRCRCTTRERYEQLLSRCPGIINDLSLKDIASFLNVTPNYLSNIRKDITFSKEE